MQRDISHNSEQSFAIHSATGSGAQSLEFAGAVSALAMLAFAFLTRSWFGSLVLPELIANTLLRFMPIGLFSAALQLFGGWAKPILLGSVILGIVAVGASIARFDRQAFDRMSLARRFGRTTGLAVTVWVPLALFGLIAAPLGIVFFATNRDLLALELALLAGVLVYAVTLYWLMPAVFGMLSREDPPADVPPESLGRRRLIGQATAGVVGFASLAYLGDLVIGVKAGAAGGNEGDISQPFTPVDEFYTVSKNLIDPTVRREGWTLNVRGMVEQPIEIDYEELLALPAVEQSATLTCISNPVGGDLIDNATWVGVRLSEVLDLAGIQGEPARVAFFGDDGYSDSFEFEKALEPTTIIAYRMNGEPLNDKHGFPARLIVPGKYGIKNGKWLRRIELVDSYRGYWQQRGWTNVGDIKTMSTFERPVDRAVLNREAQELGGVAFAGPRGISKVEYSVDDGESWIDADILDNPGPLSWTVWRATWTPASSGAYRLKVRATDGGGELQTTESAEPVPDGASGYHRIVVGIA